MDPVGAYREITDDLRRPVRVTDLVYGTAGLPTREQIDAERTHDQKDKQALEIQQGDFVSAVLADPACGAHLIHEMTQPTARALELLDDFVATGAADLGVMRVDRVDRVGVLTIQNHGCLNAEDDVSTQAMEVAIDLVLLDESIDVGIIRRAPAIHPKYAGRRIFGAGINLTALYEGQISLVEFMIERELGGVHKLLRGHPLGSVEDADHEVRREKPWVAAVESFAIGGACQWLLVLDRVIAEAGAFFNLPARKEGIIPGSANLRLSRFVGERAARQAIFFNREFAADSEAGRLLCDEFVPDEAAMDAAMMDGARELLSAGTISLVANRRALRAGAEPLEAFRRYHAVYAREQARCLYSPALIDNLERNWLAVRS